MSRTTEPAIVIFKFRIVPVRKFTPFEEPAKILPDATLGLDRVAVVVVPLITAVKSSPLRVILI